MCIRDRIVVVLYREMVFMEISFQNSCRLRSIRECKPCLLYTSRNLWGTPPFSEGITGSVEPDKRKAGVWLRRAHKGVGERSFPSRTKYATPSAGRTAPATVYKCALVNKGLMACPRILAGLQSIPQPPEDGTGQSEMF